MLVLRSTHIELTEEIQTKDFPFNHQILGIKLDNNLIKVSYIEDTLQEGLCELEFRIYNPNDPVDINITKYEYAGMVEYNNIDYDVFYKIIDHIIINLHRIHPTLFSCSLPDPYLLLCL